MEPKNTEYCENCMCYVPEGVACADEECPVEGAINPSEDEPVPLDFKQLEDMRDEEFDPYSVQDDAVTVLVERVPIEDDYQGC